MKRARFLAKFYSSFVVIIFLITAAVGFVVSYWVETDAFEQTRQSLADKALLIEPVALETLLQGEYNQSFQDKIKALGHSTSTRYTIIANDGTVLADSNGDPLKMDNHSSRPEVVKALENGVGQITRESKTLNQRLMYHTKPVMYKGLKAGYIRTSLNFDLAKQRFFYFRLMILAGAGFGAILALVLGYLLARRVTAPLEKMTTVARAISLGEFDQRLTIESQDEIGALAQAFNSMTEQLKGRIQEIAVDRNQLYAILSSLIEGVVAIDENETVVHMNEAAGRIVQADHFQSIGKKLSDITSGFEVADVLSRALRYKRRDRDEIILERQNGSRVIEMNASPLRDNKGRIVGAVAVMHDVTELRRLEALRRDFVGNVSHEFKTPVTAIRGLVETLLDDATMPEENRSRFLEMIKGQANRLSTLVTDLLTISRLESHKSHDEKERVSLNQLVHICVNGMQAAAENKSIQLGVEEEQADIMVLGDKEALRQSIDNLLTNAIKYTTNGGGVVVRLDRKGEQAKISVRDTGIGIEAIHLDRIFERFYRIDKARSREMGGTGLGLSIVKHVVMSHGGQVSVKSALGQGSTFYIFLPLLKEKRVA